MLACLVGDRCPHASRWMHGTQFCTRIGFVFDVLLHVFFVELCIAIVWVRCFYYFAGINDLSVSWVSEASDLELG